MIPSLDILYEDDFILALNKASCTHSVMQEHSIENSIAYALTFCLSGAAAISLKKEDSGLLQRLDFETSGVLLAAKNQLAWKAFHELNTAAESKKKYLTLVEGDFEESLSIRNYLGNPNRRAKKVRVYTDEPPKKARALLTETFFKKLKFDKNLNISLIEAALSLGRRHQVRAHAAFAGHPLFGDDLYGSSRRLGELLENPESLSRFPKFFLHASSISFIHPINKDRIIISAPLPNWACKINILADLSS